jgi:hypothetical protein
MGKYEKLAWDLEDNINPRTALTTYGWTARFLVLVDRPRKAMLL